MSALDLNVFSARMVRPEHAWCTLDEHERSPFDDHVDLSVDARDPKRSSSNRCTGYACNGTNPVGETPPGPMGTVSIKVRQILPEFSRNHTHIHTRNDDMIDERW